MLDELKWVVAIRAGDRKAFEQLYDQYATRVAGFVRRNVCTKRECDDIVQDVYIAAYTGRKSFSGRSKPLAWLLGIAVRRCRDHARKRSLILSDDQQIDKISNGNGSVSVSLEQAMITKLTIEDALSRLDARFREAILLVVSQGLTYKEASIVMDEPIGTIKWRVSVASVQMRQWLGQAEEGEDEL